jgi:hypothetical protein
MFRILALFITALVCVGGCTGQPKNVSKWIYADRNFDSISSLCANDAVAQLLLSNIESTTIGFNEPNGEAKSKKASLRQARNISQQALQNAFLYRTTHNQVYLNQANACLNAACNLPDWNPKHFLDLCETAFGIAVSANWLQDELSDQTKQKVTTALKTLGLDVYLELASKPGGRFWTHGENNWSVVCNSAMYVVALLNPTISTSARVKPMAYTNVEKGLQLYGSDGLWTEGHMYWSYATNYAVFAIEAEEWATKQTSPLRQFPGLDKTLPTAMALTAPSGKTFNYGDVNREGVSVTPAILKLAEYYNQQNDAITYLELIEKKAKRKLNHRFCVFHLLWYPETNGLSTNRVRPQIEKFEGVFDVVVLNTNTKPTSSKNLYLAMKGGDGGVSHQHRDAGSFILEMGKTRFFSDLGKEKYNLKNKKGKAIDKREVFRVSSSSHNTIRVGNGEQLEKKTGNINVNGLTAELDMSKCYSECTSVKRTASIDGKAIILEDQVLGCTDSIYWQGMTKGRVALKKQGAVLSIKNEKLVLEVLEPVGSVVIRVVVPKPSRAAESRNTGYSQILISCPASSNGLKIRLRPD